MYMYIYIYRYAALAPGNLGTPIPRPRLLRHYITKPPPESLRFRV